MKRQIAIFLALIITLAVVASAYADGQKNIFAKAIDDHECNAEEWHFVINQIDDEALAPASIQVFWDPWTVELVNLSKFTGKVAHYTTTRNLDSKVIKAKAEIYDEWDGQFNLSHGPCIVVRPTPTAPETTPRPQITPTPTNPFPTPCDPGACPTPTGPTPTPRTKPTITPTPHKPPGTGSDAAQSVDNTVSIPSLGVEAVLYQGHEYPKFCTDCGWDDGTYWIDHRLIGIHAPNHNELYDAELGMVVQIWGKTYIIVDIALVDESETFYPEDHLDVSIIICYPKYPWPQRLVIKMRSLVHIGVWHAQTVKTGLPELQAILRAS
ncbi:MAG: hypothetical protein ACXABD_15475 [Candidatus Thorarchaeota archaeon]|jgi:hypothetical protein